jgi:YD repeat-containing protein
MKLNRGRGDASRQRNRALRAAISKRLVVVLVSGLAATAASQANAASAASASLSSLGTRGAGPQVPAGAVAVPSLFTARSRTYKSERGIFTTTIYSAVVNFRGPEGAWKTIEGATPSELATARASAPHIDASITAGASQDCSLISNKPTESSCSATSDKVGWDGVDTDNTLIQFNIKEALSPDANILNAQLGMYLSGSSTSNSVSVSAYAALRPWTTSATWNTYDGTHAWTEAGAEKAGSDYTTTNTVLNPSVVGPPGWAHWYPTQIVQEWANGTLENRGLELADTTQRQTNDALTFNSSRASSNKPYLTISWTPRGQEDPPAYTMQPFPIDGTSTMKVNLASGDLFVNSNDLSVTPKAGPPLLAEHNYDSLNTEGGTVNPWYSLPGASVYADGSVAIGINRYDYEPFIRQSNGTFLTPRGINATLCEINETTCKRNSVDGTTKGKYALTFNENGTGPLYREGYKMDFSETGGVWSIADPEGHAIAWNYEGKLKLKDGEGHTFTRNTTEVDGFTVTSSWTESGGSGREVKYAYNSGGKLETYTDAEGHKTKYAYDEEGELKEITAPNGTVTKLNYTPSHLITKITGAEGGTWEYKYYEAGKAPAPCTATQKGVAATSPERGGLYCSNPFDEVEKVHELKPPVFKEFEVSAYDESATSPTTLYFSGAEDPPLPDGSAGPVIATYSYRYSVNGGAFTAWAKMEGIEVEVPHIAPGATVAIEVYATDTEGNVSTTVTASTAVPEMGLGDEKEQPGETGEADMTEEPGWTSEEDPPYKETLCSGSNPCGQYKWWAAMAYAERWVNSHNGEYEYFGELGGDCANFVSQALHAGGVRFLRAHGRNDPNETYLPEGTFLNGPGAWWSTFFQPEGENFPERTYESTVSWIRAGALYGHLLNYGLARILKSSEAVRPGDVIFYDEKGTALTESTITHAQIVVKTGKGVTIVAQHTTAYKHSLGYIIKKLNGEKGPLGTKWAYVIVRPIHTAANLSK